MLLKIRSVCCLWRPRIITSQLIRIALGRSHYLGLPLCLKLLRALPLYGIYIKFFSIYLICAWIQTSKPQITYNYGSLIRTIVLYLYRELCGLVRSRRQTINLYSLTQLLLSKYILIYNLYPAGIIQKYFYLSPCVEPLKATINYRPEGFFLVHQIDSDIGLNCLLSIYEISAEGFRVYAAQCPVAGTLRIYILPYKHSSALTQNSGRLFHPVLCKADTCQIYR